MGGFIDIEDALQSMLRADGYDACAKPLPGAFAMPHVTVDMLSALVDNDAQAVYRVDFEVRCESYADAARVRSEVAGWVIGLAGRDVGGVPCYASRDGLSVGSARPDGSHPTAILATVGATLRLRLAVQ